MKHEFLKEVKLSSDYYALVTNNLINGGGETQITILRENDRGYRFHEKNRVITYKHVNANIVDPEDKKWLGYSDTDESEELIIHNAPYENFKSNEEVELCKTLLYASDLIRICREETIIKYKERKVWLKEMEENGRNVYSAADAVEHAMRTRFDVHSLVKEREAEERDLYGGMTRQEWEDSL